MIKLAAIEQFLSGADAHDPCALLITETYKGTDFDAALVPQAGARQPLQLVVAIKPAEEAGNSQELSALFTGEDGIHQHGKDSRIVEAQQAGPLAPLHLKQSLQRMTQFSKRHGRDQYH